MPLNNVPIVDANCRTLTVNLELAGLMGSLSGDASRYGAFKSVIAATQDDTLAGLDPMRCANIISEVATGKYGVNVEYEVPDCTGLTVIEDCSEFDCTAGATATQTMTRFPFEIDKCVKFKVSIEKKEWYKTCCGLEEYYTEIANSNQKGSALQGEVKSLITKMQRYTSMPNIDLNTALVAKKIHRELNKPLTGVLAKINKYVINRLDANMGYNHIKDALGVPVGVNLWEMPVLVPNNPNCPPSETRIDQAAFRQTMAKFVREHPRCETGFTFIGGEKFLQLFDEAGFTTCCDTSGVNQAQLMQRALGFLSNFEYDSTLPADEGYIIENNSMAFFWLNLYANPLYKGLVNGKRLSEVPGLRTFGVTGIPVGNCRNGQMNLTFDTFINATPFECLTEPSFNVQFRSQYGLFIPPAYGCDNPTTGIYKFKLSNIC